MPYCQPLLMWLSGSRYYLKSPLYIAQEGYSLEAAWLSMDHQVALHEAGSVELRPFDATWQATLAYMEAACRKLGRARPGWAPSKELADELLAKLGPPPLQCYAIYLIAVGTGADERCVYVGQTNAEAHRFRSGHAALNALHRPDFADLDKRIYLAGIYLVNDDDHYFPIEWVHPVEWRQKVLNSIEGRLIYELQPELNRRGRNTLRCEIDLPISVQNQVGAFLDADTFGPEPRAEETDE